MYDFRNNVFSFLNILFGGSGEPVAAEESSYDVIVFFVAAVFGELSHFGKEEQEKEYCEQYIEQEYSQST